MSKAPTTPCSGKATQDKSDTALTASTIAVENFTSGLGTTILFATLMTATRPTDAGRHYTFLTTANIIAMTEEIVYESYRNPGMPASSPY